MEAPAPRHGPVRAGSVGPNNPKASTAKPDAICSGAESKPTKRAAPATNPMVPPRERSPAAKWPEDPKAFARATRLGRSAGEPTTTQGPPMACPSATQRSSGQRLAAPRVVGANTWYSPGINALASRHDLASWWAVAERNSCKSVWAGMPRGDNKPNIRSTAWVPSGIFTCSVSPHLPPSRASAKPIRRGAPVQWAANPLRKRPWASSTRSYRASRRALRNVRAAVRWLDFQG